MGSRTVLMVVSFAVYGAWSMATWVLEGRIQTLLRPEALVDRLLYAIVGNLLLGIVVGAACIGYIVRSRAMESNAAGFATPMRTAISAFAVLLVLWIINMGTSDPASPLHLISLMRHYESFAKGTLHTGDLAYFLLAIGLFLALSVRRLDRDRLAT